MVEDWADVMREIRRAVDAAPDENAMLPVRVAALARLLDAQREAETHRLKVGRYQAAEEEDQRIARHLIEHQLSPDHARHLDDPAIQYWRRSCTRLGGDMLSVGRAPDGTLHVMLADAGGGGLSAYVCLLPIIAPFYRMTEKGFPLATIVRELNHKARHALPAGRHVAAQLVAVDQREGILGIWNGGMPTAFVLDGFGHHFQEFPLRHAPLGKLDDADFDGRIEQHAFASGEQVVMISDGLIEARGTGGERFGEGGLADALVGLPRSKRRDEVVAALAAHLQGHEPDDDMTLVLIDCEQGGKALPAPASVKQRKLRHPGNWRFDLHLGANELGNLDVVPLLLDVAGRFDSARTRSGELFVILSELFNNALDHGVLRLDSRLKVSADGMETWLLLREERLAQLDHGEIRFSVEQLVEADHVWLRIRCRDSGPGFDGNAMLERLKMTTDQASHALPFGRGLMLVHSLVQRMEYSDVGNEVAVLLSLGEDISTRR
ncbi:MAG: ATP-binding SpoIIE family protein phosphatase [Pseudomonadota bacterium]